MDDTPDAADAAVRPGPSPATQERARGGIPEHSPRVVVELAQALRFYSRLPVPAVSGETDPHAAPDFRTLARVVPLAGAGLGALGGLALLVAAGLGLGPLPAAACAVATFAVTTGCMSEDGLADAADGLYGGGTPERRLEIMRDSRVGSYGVTAVALALILRVAALAGLVSAAGPAAAAAALAAAGGLSRLAGLVPLWTLPPARIDGRAAAVGRPSDASMGVAAALGCGLALVAIAPTLGLGHAALALLAAGLAALTGTRLAKRKLGGQTGDIAGATQLVADIAILLALGIGLG